MSAAGVDRHADDETRDEEGADYYGHCAAAHVFSISGWKVQS